MPKKVPEKKDARTARIIVLIVFLGACAAGLLSINFTNQPIFPVAGQVIMQYAASTPAMPTTSTSTTSTAVPEFGSNTFWLLAFAIALSWAVLGLNRRLSRHLTRRTA